MLYPLARFYRRLMDVASNRQKKRILIVEDDSDIQHLLLMHLSESYSQVKAVSNGRVGLELACAEKWDLLVLDVRLPGLDGVSICKDLRKRNIVVPILMLTSLTSEYDQVTGFDSGADDYVTKPFSVLELKARIKAQLRRQMFLHDLESSARKDSILKHGLIRLDEQKRCATVADKKIDLTVKEFDLLAFFIRSPGSAFSRNDILDSVWGYSHSGYEHTVNSHINRLRKKLSYVLNGEQGIETVWGVGYKLSEII